MSWHYLQEQEAGSWGGVSLDGAPSALLRLMPMHGKSFSPGSAMESSQDFQSGMTCEPSMENHGMDMSMLSAVDSHAPTSAQPGSAKALTAKPLGSGEKWRGSLAKYDPSARTWRTHQVSLFEGLTECSVIFPTWGLMRDGELWEQLIPDFPMRDNALGSWPTPKARDYKSGGTDPAKVQARIDRRKNQGLIDLPDAAVHRLWRPGFSGLLNPSFSEAIMDWPIGWTACEPLETGKFQEWQQQHSIY